METGITKNDLVALLSQSPHAAGSTRSKGVKVPKAPKVPYGEKLAKAYLPVALKGATQEPEFYAHLLSWNLAKGQVKDSRVALPVIALMAGITHQHTELLENALAHLSALDPRLFVRAMEFAKDLHVDSRTVRRLVERYVRNREANQKHWTKTMVQHRKSMTRLYKRYHIAPGNVSKDARVKSYEWNVLNGLYEPGSVFHAIATLKTAPLSGVIEAMRKFDLPHLITMPALGARLKDPDVLLEFIKSMSPLDMVTSMKLLDKLGARDTPALRALIDQRLSEMKSSKKGTLKTSKAAKAVEEVDEVLAEKLRAVQDAQIQAVSSIDGDWLVLADKSGSMEWSIETGRQIASLLAKAVKGNIYLVFFDSQPQFMDVTGMNYDQVLAKSKFVLAGGGTSIGCGVQLALDRKLRVDGITIISDGANSTAPDFSSAYRKYSEWLGKEPTVYFYQVPGHPNSLTYELQRAGITVTQQGIESNADYHSLPTLIAAQRVTHYSLLDEVMSTPLLKLDDVMGNTPGMEVIKHVGSTETVAG